MPAVMEARRCDSAQSEEMYVSSECSISPEWNVEIDRRLREVEEGSVELEPFDITLRRAYERIAEVHASKKAFAK